MSEPSVNLGTVMAALWTAHDVADHVVQTDSMAAGKALAHDWVGPMSAHVLSYHVVQVAALAAIGVRPSWRVAAGVAFSAGSHAFIDRRWPVLALLRKTGSPSFALTRDLPRLRVFRGGTAGPVTWKTESIPMPLHGPYLADQALHHAALFVSALIICGGRRC